MAYSIPTTSFYGSSTQRIRFHDNGVNVVTRETRVILPDGDNSEVEDNEDEDEVENFDGGSLNNMSGSDDDDDGSDFVPQVEDSNEEGECSSAYVGKGKRSKTPDQIPPYRWQRITPAKVSTDFIGMAFPDPPYPELTPFQYFKQFFDDELFDQIVGQTNLYSVQKSGKSVQVSRSELEQYFGILLMMGLIKLPQYRMYWSIIVLAFLR